MEIAREAGMLESSMNHSRKALVKTKVKKKYPRLYLLNPGSYQQVTTTLPKLQLSIEQLLASRS
jgi:hypothetical protein